jgi:hypothetical protein
VDFGRPQRVLREIFYRKRSGVIFRLYRPLFYSLPVTFATLSQIRRARRHESCELALQRLGYAGAPARRDGLGRWIEKNVLFALFQTIEDTHRRPDTDKRPCNQ